MTTVHQLSMVASTSSAHEFRRMLRYLPGRVNIVAEGDSWFDYPRKHLLSGPPANVIDHLQRRTRYKAHLLRLACNGDEAVEILSGDQRFQLCKTLERGIEYENPVHVILFSGGGNDVAGRYRLDRLLEADASAATSAEECFRAQKLRDRITQIRLGYEDLIDACEHYSPETVVVTHTYDRPYPNGRAAEFLKLIRRGPWLKNFLVAAKVPKRLRRPATSYLIDTFADMLADLALAHPGRFVVVDTRGTLRKKKLWKDELHPTSDGFELVAKKIYAAVRELQPALPAWS